MQLFEYNGEKAKPEKMEGSPRMSMGPAGVMLTGRDIVATRFGK